jgi:hypothetical protein
MQLLMILFDIYESRLLFFFLNKKYYYKILKIKFINEIINLFYYLY